MLFGKDELTDATDAGELGLPDTTVYASFLFNNANATPRIAFTKDGGYYRFDNNTTNNPAVHLWVKENEKGEKVFALVDSNS